MSCEGCKYDIIKFFNEYGDDHLNYLTFLQRHGVIRSQADCTRCGKPCRVSPKCFRFRCDRMFVCDGTLARCNYGVSMKMGTWLEGCRLSLVKVCKFVCMWLLVPHPNHQFISKELKLSQHTMVEWSQLCRNVCIDALDIRGDEIIGGPGIEVEIDEAKLGTRQNNSRGVWVDGSWVFGMFERASRRCFIVEVPDRSASTLIDIIFNRIIPGTSIFTERWKGYYDPLINHPQYQQLIEDHQIKFIDPDAVTEDGKMTWKKVRAHFAGHNGGEGRIAGYLAEYCWKKKTPKEERIHKFLIEVSRQFDPSIP